MVEIECDDSRNRINNDFMSYKVVCGGQNGVICAENLNTGGMRLPYLETAKPPSLIVSHGPIPLVISVGITVKCQVYGRSIGSDHAN